MDGIIKVQFFSDYALSGRSDAMVLVSQGAALSFDIIPLRGSRYLLMLIQSYISKPRSEGAKYYSQGQRLWNYKHN